jgi:hypothetical protein
VAISNLFEKSSRFCAHVEHEAPGSLQVRWTDLHDSGWGNSQYSGSGVVSLMVERGADEVWTRAFGEKMNVNGTDYEYSHAQRLSKLGSLKSQNVRRRRMTSLLCIGNYDYVLSNPNKAKSVDCCSQGTSVCSS